MQMRKLGSTGLDIAPLVLGGNVFGSRIDREQSFAVLDAFVEAGFNAVDTADVYSRFIPGLVGGESERVLGEWMKERGVRDRVIVITKGGLSMGEGLEGLSPDYLTRACEESLRRLKTDYIDVYMAHIPDPKVPIEATLETFQKLIDAGKVRHAACSNYPADQLAAALEAAGEGRARFQVLEPHFNLAERGDYQGELEELCLAQGIGVIPYFALASGFLTGKYRSQDDFGETMRAKLASRYFSPENLALLERLDAVAARRGATLAQVALAWLLAHPSITAPIASATSLDQLADILGSVEIELTADDIAELNG